MKIRTTSLDRLCSLVVRYRDGFRCQRCGKQHTKNSQGLHWAHCFGRGMHSVRHDLSNSASLCYGCHSFLDQRPLEKYDFWKKRIGEKEFDYLMQRANTTKKFSPQEKQELRLWLKNRLKELEIKSYSRVIV